MNMSHVAVRSISYLHIDLPYMTSNELTDVVLMYTNAMCSF